MEHRGKNRVQDYEIVFRHGSTSYGMKRMCQVQWQLAQRIDQLGALFSCRARGQNSSCVLFQNSNFSLLLLQLLLECTKLKEEILRV